MVGHHDKIQGSTQLRGSAQGSYHLLTFGKTVGCIRTQDIADKRGICRVTGMDMGIAKVRMLHTGVLRCRDKHRDQSLSPGCALPLQPRVNSERISQRSAR